MTAKNMTLKEMKDKIVDNYYDTFTDEARTKTFDDLCSSNYITEYTYGIKNFPELGWHYNLEKHYNVIIPIEYLFTHDLAIQASENYEEEILENDDDKLVISYHNYGGDWQKGVDFDVTICADGHSEYDLESLKNDKRDYSNYINEIEGIANHLNYDTQNLTGDQLGYIIENYIDVLFEYLNDNIFETLEEFTLNCEKYPYDTEIKKYLALPLELKKELFEKIG